MDSSLEALLSSIATAGNSLVNNLGPLKHQVTNSPSRSKLNPFDEASLISQGAWTSAQSIISSCQDLITLLTPTPIKLLEDAFSVSSTAALGIASHLSISDAIEDIGEGKRGVGIKELALKVKTGDVKLASVMHSLTASGIFVEAEDGLFYNNRLSNGMRTEFNPGGKEMLEFYSTFLGKAALDGLLPVMLDPSRMNSIAARDSGFAEAYSTSLNSIEYCLLPENKQHLEKVMAGIPWLTGVVATELVQSFNWSQWGTGFTVCDMGCGDGGIMARLKEKEKCLKIVCQELNPMVPITTKTFEDRLPGAIADGSVEIQIHDYFTPQKVQADIYWMRGVLHDYSDDDCRRILANLRQCLVAAPEARVLINEIVVPRKLSGANISIQSRHSTGADLKHSSFPKMISLMQLHSTAFLEGSERTYEEWENLFESAGYKIRQFYSLRIFTSIFELRLKG